MLKVNREEKEEMKSLDSKYIDSEDIKKMRNFYCRSNFKGVEKKRRVNVLMKNLEQVLRNIASEKKFIDASAQEDFYDMVQEFFQKCRQEKYALSYGVVQAYKKARSITSKQTEYTAQKTIAMPKVQPAIASQPQAIQIEEKEPQGLWGKLKSKFNNSKQKVGKVLKYAAATSLAVLSFGNCNTTSFLQNKKVEQEKVRAEAKPEQQSVDTTFVIKQMQLPQSEKVDSVITPYQAEFYHGLKANEKNYEKLVKDLISQFQENIKTLQSSKTNRRQFYLEQERLIGKYGKTPHIIPQSSCESMSYATFLKVLDSRSSSDDYVAKACKDLLLQVPNPHACQSNKQTFSSHYSRNLRTDLKEELKRNKYGIYMVWIKNEAGNLHRMTVIGSGDNKAYLMAYNNNRIARMDIDKLDKLPAQNGYFCDLGGTIKSRANEMVADKINVMQEKMNKTYYAFLLHQNKHRV